MPNLLSVLLLIAFTATLSLRGAETAVRVLNDVPYLGLDRAEKLDLYLPEREAGKLSPALVWIHGGGWTGGTKGEARAKEIGTTLAKAGYVVVSVDYRLGPGAWPQNLLDCKNAVRFLRARAVDYGIDRDRIAVAGGSAGGHLALMVGFTTGQEGLEPEDLYPGISSGVRAVIDMYGITNFMTRRETDAHGNPLPARKLGGALRVFGAETEDAPVLRKASPVTHVTAKSPPVLILHGRGDTTVDYLQSVELAEVLQQQGVAHELILLDDVGHTFAFETWGRKKLSRDLRPTVFAFLDKHLK